MLEMESRLAQQYMTISTQYPVMIIGGAEDKVNSCDILKAFFESAGGDNAKIGIIPAASREPTVVGDRYYKIFTGMGARQTQVMDVRHREECQEDRWIDALNDCTGVFVTGGDQVRLCDLLGETRLTRAIKAKLKDGDLVLAGTSAGAAMMGEKMIAGGSSGESPNHALVDLSDGLGIVPELLVDQHFHNRNRMARLLSAIAANADKLGIGIDEDTCIALMGNGTFEVLGKGTITIVDPGNLTHTNASDLEETDPLSLHNLKLHVLKQGDRYDYKNRFVM
ncbi:MAG: cyanophycinase [Phormidesmis sp.]